MAGDVVLCFLALFCFCFCRKKSVLHAYMSACLLVHVYVLFYFSASMLLCVLLVFVRGITCGKNRGLARVKS